MSLQRSGEVMCPERQKPFLAASLASAPGVSPQTVDVTIGQRILARRLARGLSRDQLAQGAEIGEQMLGKIETGHARPGAVQLYRLANALGLKMSDLFTPRAP